MSYRAALNVDHITVPDAFDMSFIKDYGGIFCPGCGIHLENGVNLHEPAEAKIFHNKTHEVYCLACGSEFGEPIVKVDRKKPSSHSKNMTLRARIWALLDTDPKASPAQIALDMSVTYANAHYHVRTWRKANKVKS